MDTARQDLLQREYWDVGSVAGPLVFLKTGARFPVGAVLNLTLHDGSVRQGQVLEVSTSHAAVQVLQGTQGIDVAHTAVSLEATAARIRTSRELLGRRFNGSGTAIDGLPPLLEGIERDVSGSAINPVARSVPSDFIETGLSSIDGFNTLVRGQKLPVFFGAGLPANELVRRIVRDARVRGEEESFAIVFGAMGITEREAGFFQEMFESGDRATQVVAFLNRACDPAIERLLTPRCALTAAEYLAFDLGYQVLVILTDITNYCEALREVASAREEIPGRRGYPGYLYTDLASLYERAGRVRGRTGSITQIPLVSMPDDDLTHPIPDLTGYITEGQIVLSRSLHRQGVFPPVDVLPSLSRLMNHGIGEGRTREDHRSLANQLYACYARGRDVRRLTTVVGEGALSELDGRYLRFADRFETRLINQGNRRRSIEETLSIGWELLQELPRKELTRLSGDLINRYHGNSAAGGDKRLDPWQRSAADGG